jgi:uncharacterized protein (DUF58 family)
VARPHAELAAQLSAELRQALSRRKLSLARRVRGLTSGAHRSRRVAEGDEFLDHRAYTPGDDLRRLDWRAAARRDRWVLRRTRAEGNHDLVLLLDDGPNMDYGGQSSKRAALESCAAALAWIAGRDHDRVGFGYTSGRDGGLHLAPSARAETLRALAESLRRPAETRQTDWLALLEGAATRLEGPALVVLMSDWLDPFGGDERDEERAWERLGELRARGHTLLLLQLVHGDELDFPWSGDEVLRFVDPRGCRPQREGSGSSLRAGYLERLTSYLVELETHCERHGVLRLMGRSDEPLAPYLLNVLDSLAHGVAVSEGSRAAP